MPLTMKLDDHEFTLSDSCLKTIAATLWHTRAKERGNMLCARYGEIDAGREHIGGRGSITERNCPANSITTGHFHTHPTGVADPSWWDAYAIMKHSQEISKPYLGCRATKAPIPSGEIQCQTVKRVPTPAEVAHFKGKRRKMRYTWAKQDWEIMEYITEPYSFPARKIPEIIKPPVPVLAPRIKVEELMFANSAYHRITNLDTEEVTIKQVY